MRGHFKALVLLAWSMAVVALLIHVPMDWAKALATLRGFLGGFGLGAEWVFAMLTALFVAMGAPRLAFYAIGGVLFGFVGGLAWALAGSLLGSWLMFRVVRWGGRRWVRRRFAEHRLLRNIVDKRPDAMGVVMARQLPLSNVFINTGLALSRVSSRDYLLGSLLGFLPQGAVASLIGSGAGKSLTQEGMQGWLQLAAGVTLAVVLSVWAYRRRQRRGTGRLGHHSP
ncbi:MAG: VTT domain-containing protein [Candidatus Contendobacter sp.]|jgi:uncharacterized membrane protein YdjX (TVP38/TMEM64 family)|nr:VTT domain-containing protein [Candidatus Contendobacter sp.]